MNAVHKFHRKRPHLLPPLPSLQASDFRSMDQLQPPDLLLIENRLGSPAPKRIDSKESDYIVNPNSGKPMIRVFESCHNENEKCNWQFDQLSNSGLKDLFQQKDFNLCEHKLKYCGRENGFMKNLSRKPTDHLREDQHKMLKSNAVLPLKNLKADSQPKIPSRYTPLKPIGPSEFENFNEP